MNDVELKKTKNGAGADNGDEDDSIGVF